jgi:hypothetical protein
MSHRNARFNGKKKKKKKSPKFLPVTMTLVSSANKIVSDTEFILRGRSFVYIMNNRGHRIDPRGTRCVIVPQSEKKFWGVLGDFTWTFCLLLAKQDLNQSSDTPGIPWKCNLSNKISWFTQSKAFAESPKIPPTCFFLVNSLECPVFYSEGCIFILYPFPKTVRWLVYINYNSNTTNS